MSKNKDAREIQREIVIRYKIYDMLSIGLFIIGVVIFFIFYSRFAKGDVMSFIHNPFLIFMMLFPFIPAAFFALRAKALQKKIYKISKSEASITNKK